MADEDLRDWLVIVRAMAAHGGRAGIHELLATAGGPAALLALPGRTLAAHLPPDTVTALITPDQARLAADRRWLDEAGVMLIAGDDPRFPPLLTAIPDPPVALFVRGAAPALSRPQLAIVGSRNPTAGGRDTAEAFAAHLATCGLSITSGLAAGIDAAAHAGALAAGGVTLAVCGTGLDTVYPAANRALAHRIVASGGALISEFPPGTPARRENFPQRNRIISGLALGTLVVEAALQSGSLITARLASEQGREVFAIPGSIHNPLARGCHRLLRDGAKLVEDAGDVLEELGPLVALTGRSAVPGSRAAQAGARDPDHQRVLDALGHDPVPVDLLAARTGLGAGVLSSILLMLELDGLVSATAGGRYARNIREG